jgi:phospholipid N-methyltransferase
MELVDLERALTEDEVWFVLENYNPMANHNVGKGGIFFTPQGLARDFAVMVSPKGRVLDLCGGIGRLSHAVLHEDQYSHDITEIVAVEINPEFVRVGRKILPQVTWFEGSIFDFDLMGALGAFDYAISNPPYGNIPVGVSEPMRIKTIAHLMAIEIALRASYNGCSMIIPYTDVEYDFNTGRQQTSNNLKRLKKAFPGISVTPEPIDTTIYEDEWEGAAPKVAIADIDVFECEETFPLGFEFNRSFATPKVQCTLCWAASHSL